jgi:integrase/recombinase XerD
MKTYLAPAEIALLEKSADNLRDRLLIRMLFHVGCRVNEAIISPSKKLTRWPAL